jgi:hypothetical protein
MINNGHLAVNSKKAIFKKTKGSDYIIHGLFIDDMISPSVTTSERSSGKSIPKTLKSLEEAVLEA